MGSKTGMADLKMRKDDGSFFNRVEMEQQIRESDTVHHRRLRAIGLGLSPKIAYDMFPISVTHWLLDQWVSRGEIYGDVLGVRSEFKADEDKDYFNQLTQRLQLFIENGHAIKPNPGEGIDMNRMNMPPGMPGMPPAPNGQGGAPSFTPPAPPMMPPSMPGVPGMPATMNVPQPPGPPMMAQPPMPPQPPMGGMPPMIPQPSQPPQQQFSPPGFPGAAPQFPPQVPQQMQQPQQPQMAPQQQMTPQPSQMAMYQQPQQSAGGEPHKADPTRQWGQPGKRDDGTQRARRTKEEIAEDAAYEAYRQGGAPQQQQAPAPQPQMQQPVPQAAPPQMIAPPSPFTGMPNTTATLAPQPMMPSFPSAAPPPMQVSAPAPTPSNDPNEELATAEQVAHLMSRVKILEAGVAMLLRVLYQAAPTSPESAGDLYQVLTEVCKIVPPR
jgi:hypothetical protein